MAGVHAHLGQAEHNLKLYEGLDRKVFSDWAATVLFYSALHYVDAFIFQQLKTNPSGHSNRDQYLNKVTQLKALRPDYRILKDNCHNARYMPPTRFSEKELGDMKTDNLGKIMRELREFVEQP